MEISPCRLKGRQGDIKFSMSEFKKDKKLARSNEKACRTVARHAF